MIYDKGFCKIQTTDFDIDAILEYTKFLKLQMKGCSSKVFQRDFHYRKKFLFFFHRDIFDKKECVKQYKELFKYANICEYDSEIEVYFTHHMGILRQILEMCSISNELYLTPEQSACLRKVEKDAKDWLYSST